jgi:uncharacterized cupredoxin-like copper-binding protein
MGLVVRLGFVVAIGAVLILLVCVGVGATTAKTAPVTVTIAGNGRVVLNNGESLFCNGACDATLHPASGPVVITARPAAGSRFTNWTGSCLGTRPTCTLPAGHRAHVSAFFAQAAVTKLPPVSTVTVVAGKPSEFQFSLSATTVKLGAVTFNVSNAGALPHDFEVCSVPSDGTATSCVGTDTSLISVGTSSALIVTFTAPGTYEYLCTVAGHAEAGMKGLLTVAG